MKVYSGNYVQNGAKCECTNYHVVFAANVHLQDNLTHSFSMVEFAGRQPKVQADRALVQT